MITSLDMVVENIKFFVELTYSDYFWYFSRNSVEILDKNMTEQKNETNESTFRIYQNHVCFLSTKIRKISWDVKSAKINYPKIQFLFFTIQILSKEGDDHP